MKRDNMISIEELAIELETSPGYLLMLAQQYPVPIVCRPDGFGVYREDVSQWREAVQRHSPEE